MLAAFLPRFNARFGVPAVQPGSAYRSVNPDLDLGGVRCIKELRRVAKDNTVQYHGRSTGTWWWPGWSGRGSRASVSAGPR